MLISLTKHFIDTSLYFFIKKNNKIIFDQLQKSRRLNNPQIFVNCNDVLFHGIMVKKNNKI